MLKNDEGWPFMRLLQNVGLRLEDPVVRRDRDIARIPVAALSGEKTPVARGPCTVQLTSPMEPHDLMEGGLGI